MSTENLFEQAVRLKVRFEYKGSLSAEDLWDLSLEDLDAIYRKLSGSTKKDENSLLSSRKTKEDKMTELKMGVVKYVFEVKQSEMDAQKLKAEKRKQKEKLMDVLERKQNAELENKTPEEIRAMLDELAD